MFRVVNKFKKGVLDILLPRFCLGCGREGKYICRDCEVFLSEVDPRTKNFGAGVNLVSVWEYEGLMEKLIWEIKYHRKYHIISELAEKVLEKVEFNLPEDTYITYVPMYKKRERERGFNQAELLARKIGEMTGRPVARMLEKIKDNKSQVGLGPKEREENVKGVFASVSCGVSRQFSGVLLVDDVYTTGATAKECVRVLRKAGVKKVWVFTLARKLRI